MLSLIFLLFTVSDRSTTGQNSETSTGVTICPPSNMDDACTKIFDNLMYVVTSALPAATQSMNMDNMTKPMTNMLLMPLNFNVTKICCFLSQFSSANQACCRQMYKYCSPWTSTMCTSNGSPSDYRRMMGGGDKNLTLFQLIRCSMGSTAPGTDSNCPKQAIEATDVNNANYDVNQFINEAIGWFKKKIGVE